MKKTVIYLTLIAAILFALYSFNDYRAKEDYNKIACYKEREHYNCDEVLNNIKGETPEEKGQWLWANIKNPSDEFCECVAERHKICKDVFYEDVERAWDARSIWAHMNPFYQKYTAIPYQDILEVNPQNSYEYFLGFEDTYYTNTITLKKLASFTDKETCYSFPLMHGVFLVNNLKADSEIDFAKAIGNNKQWYIYFRVKNQAGEYSYYDISDDPGKGLLSFKPSPI